MILVHHALRDTARAHPNQVAVVAGDRRMSFADIDRDSDRLAAEFQRLGVQRGDRVAAMIENAPEMVVALWAAFKAGAIFTPINHTTKTDKLAVILADCEAACVVAPSSLSQRVLPAAPQAQIVWAEGIATLPDATPRDPGLIDQDLALLIYTSGSTGRPKGVMMTHHTVINNLRAIAGYLGNTADDVVLCILPLSFGYGLFQVLCGASVGYTVVLERSFAFPYEVLKQIGRHRVTGLPGVPTIFTTLLQYAPFTGLDLSSLRYLTNAAAPLPPAHIRKLRQLIPHADFFSMYGLTECTRVSYLEPARLDAKIGSVGRAMPNCEAYVADEAGVRLPPGEIGELVVRGSSVMRGYWRRPEETDRVLRDGKWPGEKVLHTGDLFYADADGDLHFIGRKDDVFKVRGEKVSPCEVESVLCELEAVSEVAVIGVPDQVDGMAVKAFVVLRPGTIVTEQELRKHCRVHLEAHMVPKLLELCEALPKTDSGKITKSALRRSAG